MIGLDPHFAALTAPGAPFEIGEREGLRQFLRMPCDLNAMIEGARIHGGRTFIVEEADDGSNRRLSFDEVFALRDRLAALLQIRRGERVAICMRNRAEWIIGFLAVIKAGGVAALLNSRGSPAELVAMIDEVTPELVLADSERARLIREGGFAGRMFDLTRPFDEPEIERRGHVEADHPDKASSDDPCVILFTSGTTGRVKGAVLSHRNVITGLASVQLSGMQVLHATAERMGMPVERFFHHLIQHPVKSRIVCRRLGQRAIPGAGGEPIAAPKLGIKIFFVHHLPCRVENLQIEDRAFRNRERRRLDVGRGCRGTSSLKRGQGDKETGAKFETHG